jgi:hypothetical protein
MKHPVELKVSRPLEAAPCLPLFGFLAEVLSGFVPAFAAVEGADNCNQNNLVDFVWGQCYSLKIILAGKIWQF